MRFIGMFLALLLIALLAYWLTTGSFSFSPSSPLNQAARESGVPGGSFTSGNEVKRRVEGMLQKKVENQEKAINEAAP